MSLVPFSLVLEVLVRCKDDETTIEALREHLKKKSGYKESRNMSVDIQRRDDGVFIGRVTHKSVDPSPLKAAAWIARRTGFEFASEFDHCVVYQYKKITEFPHESKLHTIFRKFSATWHSALDHLDASEEDAYKEHIFKEDASKGDASEGHAFKEDSFKEDAPPRYSQ